MARDSVLNAHGDRRASVWREAALHCAFKESGIRERAVKVALRTRVAKPRRETIARQSYRTMDCFYAALRMLASRIRSCCDAIFRGEPYHVGYNGKGLSVRMFPIALARSARADALVDQFGACVRIGRQGVKLLRIASNCRDSQTELARSRSNFGAPLRTCATVRRRSTFSAKGP